MALTVYDVIKGPVFSEKASQLLKKDRLVVAVHMQANKPMIKEAIEKLFDVKVDKVRVMVRKGKVRTFKRIQSMGSSHKRAIVTLKPGYSLKSITGQDVQAVPEAT